MARINFEVYPEFRDRYNDTIPWGVRGEVMRALTEMTLDLVDKYGKGVLQLIVERNIHPSIGVKHGASRYKGVDHKHGDAGVNGPDRRDT